jgi:hypothetical protein
MNLQRKLLLHYVLPVLVVLGSVFLVLLDWPLGYAGHFYAAHAILAGLISSAIPVGIGATVIKAYIDRQDKIRWNAASQVAYNSLSRAPLAQRRIMWFLLCGGTYVSDRDFPLERSTLTDVGEILDRFELSQLSEEEAFIDGRPDFESRLDLLVRDRDWQMVAYAALRDTSHGFRVIIARWAPLLSSTQEGQTILRHVASQEKELTRLYIKLVPTVRRGDKLGSVVRSDFTEAWHRTFANAVVLNAYLARMGEEYGRQDVMLGRHFLTSTQLELLRMKESRGKSVPKLFF